MDTTQTNPRECTICTTVETSENKMLFLSDIYDKHPHLPPLCGCSRETTSNFCSDCLIAIAKSCVTPSEDPTDEINDLIWGDKVVSMHFACPFCRTKRGMILPPSAWDRVKPVKTADSLIVIFSEAMKAIKGGVKERRFYPESPTCLFFTDISGQRIFVRYTIVAEHVPNDTLVLTLKPRLVVQTPCCPSLCSYKNMMEFGGGGSKTTKIIVCVPPRRSKRVADGCVTKQSKKVKID